MRRLGFQAGSCIGTPPRQKRQPRWRRTRPIPADGCFSRTRAVRNRRGLPCRRPAPRERRAHRSEICTIPKQALGMSTRVRSGPVGRSVRSAPWSQNDSTRSSNLWLPTAAQRWRNGRCRGLVPRQFSRRPLVLKSLRDHPSESRPRSSTVARPRPERRNRTDPHPSGSRRPDAGLRWSFR